MEHQTGNGVARLSWTQAHRLEVTLRVRAAQLGGRTRCPGCGRPFADGDQRMTLAGVTVHPACLCDCAEADPAV